MLKLPDRAAVLLAALPLLTASGCGPTSSESAPVVAVAVAAPAPAPTGTPEPLPAATATVAAPPVIFGQEAQGVGDPNPFFQDGRYHVFYLQNEGRHPWRMSSSTDLSSWTAPVDAVPVGGAGEADYWTGSGSVVADPTGGYRIFYTGHLPEGGPRETTMVARADTLAGPWRKQPGQQFTGSGDYDSRDFRDPFVFRNDEAGAYWMLLTSRHRGKAAIALYTSPDLERWSPAAPLYTETSSLNLEVPDLFREGPDWFLLFSDQRDASRQTRYLRATSSRGPFVYGRFDALDGRGFYAGKTAGTGAERMLFGWIANRRERRDDGELLWGGDLIAHAVRRTADGMLAVDIAEPIARQFTTLSGRMTVERPAAAPIDRGTRLTAELTVRPGDRFGIRFDRGGAGAAVAEIDTAAQEVRFVVGGRTVDAPRVALPATADGRYRLDMILDPARSFGVLYVNRFRALSFRYYAMAGTTPVLYATQGLIAGEGEVRIK